MKKRNLKNDFPRITIITPSYNQAAFIERTIQSVLSQDYPNLEYIVMDGGSSDGTVEVLKRYKKDLIYFSHKDSGQSHAINKGLKIATGEIIGYLNSDDYLEKGAFAKIADFFQTHKEAAWVTGKCRIVDQNDKEVRHVITFYKNFCLKYLCKREVFCIIQFISQPATFLRKNVVDTVGYFDESLHYDMDLDYWLRIWKNYDLFYMDRYLANYRVHTSSKAVTSPETQFHVASYIIRKHTKGKIVLFLHNLHDAIALRIYRYFYSEKI